MTTGFILIKARSNFVVKLAINLPIYQETMAFTNLPTGNWNIIANGYSGSLIIKLNDNGAILDGSTIFGNKIIGFCDKVTGKLTFTRIVGSEPDNHQVLLENTRCSNYFKLKHFLNSNVRFIPDMFLKMLTIVINGTSLVNSSPIEARVALPVVRLSDGLLHY